jgi:hypothetical protein
MVIGSSNRLRFTPIALFGDVVCLLLEDKTDGYIMIDYRYSKPQAVLDRLDLFWFSKI